MHRELLVLDMHTRWRGDHACMRRCSGDDAVNACAKAAPRFVRCTLQGRKCGVRAYDCASAAFTDCVFEDCGEHGLQAFDASSLSLCRRACSPPQHLAAATGTCTRHST